MTTSTQMDFLSAWSDGLIRMSLQATVTVGVLLVLERLVRTLGPQWRCWCWRLMYLKLALVFVLPVALVIPVWPAAEILPEPKLVEPGFAALPDESVRVDKSVVRDTASAAYVQKPEAYIWTWKSLLFVGWVAGVGLHLAGLIAQRRQIQQLLSSGERVTNPAVRDLLRQVAHDVGLSKLPEIWGVTGPASPMVVGLWTPRILWPRPQGPDESRWVREDLRMALAHELGHVLRRDLWWNLLAAAVQTILWFHPLTWIAVRRYLVAQESACDQLALGKARLDRLQFADLLIRIAQRPCPGAWNPAGVPLVHGQGLPLLKERLKNMMLRVSPRRRRLVTASAALVGLALAGLPWSPGAAQTQSSKKTGSQSQSSRKSASKSGSSSSGGIASGSAQAGGFAGGSASGSSGGSAGGFSTGGGNASGSGNGGANSLVNTSRFGNGLSNGAGLGSLPNGNPGLMQANGQSGGKTISGGFTQSSSSGSSSVASGTGTAGQTNRTGNGLNRGRNRNKNPGTSLNTGTTLMNQGGQTTSSSNGSSMSVSREVNDDGEVIRVSAQENQRDIQIRQSDAEGIEVTVRPTQKNANQGSVTVTAESAEALKKQNPEAYELYQKYLGSRLPQIRGDGGPIGGAAAAGGEGGNPAQQLMKQQLRGLLEQEDLPEAARTQIQQMLNQIPE